MFLCSTIEEEKFLCVKSTLCVHSVHFNDCVESYEIRFGIQEYSPKIDIGYFLLDTHPPFTVQTNFLRFNEKQKYE